MIPDIAIPSYMGGDHPDVRFEKHLRQRQVLFDRFPNRTVWTYGSCYTRRQLKEMRRRGYHVVHREEKWPKWRIHNRVLRRLYQADSYKAVLFLDDDVVPRQGRDPVKDVNAGYVDPAPLAEFWFQHPEQMGAPCAFFASAGLLFDAYFRAKPLVEEAPCKVVGWAMMARSDLGVLWTEELVRALTHRRRYVMDDVAFRVLCAAEGKPVVKHNRAFFKTLQSQTDGHSTYAATHDDRVEMIQADTEVLRKLYPEVMARLLPSRGRKKESKGGTLFRR